MRPIYGRCCGLDVHKKTVVACRLTPEGSQTRAFGTMTTDLIQLREWLLAGGVTHVAMESTGVYWKPVFNLLENHGMEVLFAENGRDGIDVLTQNADVDLVLMDIMMPEMDGYEAIRAVRSRKEFQKLPIISLTAKAMKGDREKSVAAGASDYITKPVNTDQLLSLMRVWLYR